MGCGITFPMYRSGFLRISPDSGIVPLPIAKAVMNRPPFKTFQNVDCIPLINTGLAGTQPHRPAASIMLNLSLPYQRGRLFDSQSPAFDLIQNVVLSPPRKLGAGHHTQMPWADMTSPESISTLNSSSALRVLERHDRSNPYMSR